MGARIYHGYVVVKERWRRGGLIIIAGCCIVRERIVDTSNLENQLDVDKFGGVFE